MSDAFSTIFEAPLDQPPSPDDVVAATMAWHFSPATGSPYWLAQAASLGFDPRTEVRTVADLALFDGLSVDWAAISAVDLIPRGHQASDQFGVYESGGATGAPKRIVDATSRLRNVQWQNSILDGEGFPQGGGSWLHIGPTGPHIMSKNITNLARMRGMVPMFVDLDPRWARRCVAQGRQADFHAYLDHVLDQVRDVIASQPVRAISSTPPMLQTIVARADVYEPLRAAVRGIIWGGTSTDDETIRLLRDEVFPDAVIQGAYGNTMMGVAPQRPTSPQDTSACVFRPFFPYSLVDLVDPDDPAKPVAQGAEGRVKVTTLTRDLFVPPTLERDAATRRTPLDAAGIELSDVHTLQSANASVVEGVY